MLDAIDEIVICGSCDLGVGKPPDEKEGLVGDHMPLDELRKRHPPIPSESMWHPAAAAAPSEETMDRRGGGGGDDDEQHADCEDDENDDDGCDVTSLFNIPEELAPLKPGMIATKSGLDALCQQIASQQHARLEACLEERRDLMARAAQLQAQSETDACVVAALNWECSRLRDELAARVEKESNLSEFAALQRKRAEEARRQLTEQSTEHARQMQALERELASAKRAAEDQREGSQWQMHAQQELDRRREALRSLQSSNIRPFCDVPTLIVSAAAVARAMLESEGRGKRKFFVNPCLDSSCDALHKFGLACVKHHNYHPRSIGFHCTKSSDDIANIMCNGFDAGRRQTQRFGPGEYFSSNRQGAKPYDQVGEVTIVVIILDKSEKRTASDDDGTTWPQHKTVVPQPGHGCDYIVVNNPTDNSATFCLPIGVIALPTFTFPSCRSHRPPVQRVDEVAPAFPTAATLTVQSDAGMVATTAPIVPQLLAMRPFTYRFGGHGYEVDRITQTPQVILAVQTNTVTGKQRTLHLKLA